MLTRRLSEPAFRHPITPPEHYIKNYSLTYTAGGGSVKEIKDAYSRKGAKVAKNVYY
jgi:hypothetical protein